VSDEQPEEIGCSGRQVVTLGPVADMALASARELPTINLSHSLRLCLLLRGTDLFERAVLRWPARYCREVVAVDLDEAQAVLACLAALRGPRASVAAQALYGRLDPVQIKSARAELDHWGRQ
jgi:hypothetical protein